MIAKIKLTQLHNGDWISDYRSFKVKQSNSLTSLMLSSIEYHNSLWFKPRRFRFIIEKMGEKEMTNLVPQHIIDRILEFDPSDRYHMPDEEVEKNFLTKQEAYYAAINRVVALLKGDIKDWMDK